MAKKVIVDYGYEKRTFNAIDTVITNYNTLEEFKQEYITQHELSHSEKLLIEDFYDWLINQHF